MSTTRKRPRKSVGFVDIPQIREYTRNSGDDIYDSKYAIDLIIEMLNTTVRDVINSLGEDYKESRVTASQWRKYNWKIIALKFPPIANFDNAELSKIIESQKAHAGYTMAQYISKYLDHKGTVHEYFGCLIMLRTALKIWIEMRHCKNKCASVISYENKLRTYKRGVNNNLVKVCTDGHDTIMKMLDIKDIRIFDTMLQEASGYKCSIIE
jgi:hypothetical protein